MDGREDDLGGDLRDPMVVGSTGTDGPTPPKCNARVGAACSCCSPPLPRGAPRTGANSDGIWENCGFKVLNVETWPTLAGRGDLGGLMSRGEPRTPYA